MKKRTLRSAHRRLMLTCALAAAATVGGLAGVSPAGALGNAPGSAAAHRLLLPAASPGRWTLLAKAPNLVNGQSTPAIWLSPTDNALIVWHRQVKPGTFTYETVEYSAKGTVIGAPSQALDSSKWSSLLSEPAIVSDGSEPLIIFEGGGSMPPYNDGCIVGDLLTPAGWKLQPWSLSRNCNVPGVAATDAPGGVVSAAWPGGGWNGYPIDHGVQYRIGTSPSFPATGLDGRIPAKVEDSNVSKTGEVSDLAGNGHVYVVWALTAAPLSDAGYYVKDVTANSPVQRVPGTGETSVTPNTGVFSLLGVTNTNTHGGVWILYCTNTPVCSLRMWRVGAARAIVVPDSSHAENYSISAGPDGRLWIAWTSSQYPYKMYTVRTNKADTRFGPIVTYGEPCDSPGWPALTSGSFARVDVAMMCTDTAGVMAEYAMQSLAELSVRASTPSITNTASHSVTFTVTDAGDPVAGATVSVAGVKGKTGPSGTVTLTLPAGLGLGEHGITAAAADYFSAHATLLVKS